MNLEKITTIIFAILVIISDKWGHGMFKIFKEIKRIIKPKQYFTNKMKIINVESHNAI